MYKHLLSRILSAGTVLLLAGITAFGSACSEQNIPLQVTEEVVSLPGLTEEYKIIFIADTHLSLCDERDASVSDKAAERYEFFKSKNGTYADKTFDAIMDYVKKESPDLLILGGDILDSAMHASIEYLQGALDEIGIPYIYSMGNHDFEYGNEYFTPAAYDNYFTRLDGLTQSQNGYQSFETENFHILAADDANSQISPGALNELITLKQSGKPILLITHVPIQPLDDEELIMLTKQIWGEDSNGNSRVLLGYKSCLPNETTTAFINEAIADDSPVRLILAGHIHFYHKDELGPVTTQIITGAGYEGELLTITLTP